MGGAEGLAAWIIEALKRDYRLTVLTWEPVDFAAVNWFFGIELQAYGIRTPRTATPGLVRLAKMFPTPVVRLKLLYLSVRARRQAGRFDAVMCGLQRG